MIKKLSLIFSVILTLALVGLGVYYFFFMPKDGMQNPESKGTIIDTSAEETPKTQISDKEVVGYFVDGSNKVKYYQKENGHVISANTDGSGKKEIDKKDNPGLQYAKWDEKGRWVIFLDAKNMFSTYDYVTGESLTFSPLYRHLDFIKNGKVMYTFRGNGVVDLSTADPSGQGWQKILTLNSDDIHLREIPNTDKLSYTLTPSAFRASSLGVISLTKKDVQSILSDKYGLDVVWSPTGENGIITYSKERGSAEMEMALIDKAGNISKTFNPGTVGEKIVWSKDGKKVYFTKMEVPNTVVLPDDYINGALKDTKESLYMLNIDKKSVSEVYKNLGILDSMYLTLNDSATKLFFINKNDQQLYSIDLK
jgi:hypothetical protein